MTEIMQATPEHALQIAITLRDSDAEELRAASGRAPLEVLLESLKVTDADVWSLMVEGHPVAIGGLTPSPSLPGWAVVWVVGSDWIDEKPKTFTRVMRERLGWALANHTGLYNWVDERNESSVRWLDMMGFNVGSPAPHGKNDMPFRYFWIRANDQETA